jgi:hypothetical protein
MANTVTLPFPAFYYPTFGAGLAAPTCCGVASIVGNALQLAAASPPGDSSAAAWNPTPVRMDLAWVAKFTFVIPAGTTAQGFTFAIQNQGPAVYGGADMNLGVAGLTDVLAVVFGLANHASLGAWPSAPFLGVVSASGGSSLLLQEAGALAKSSAGESLADGNQHQVMVQYFPGTPSSWLRVYLDSAQAPQLQAPVNIVTALGLTGNTAWVGLTAGQDTANTGSVQIRSWSFAQAIAARVVVSPSPATGSFAVTAASPNPPAVAGPLTASLQVCTDGLGNTWAPGTANANIPIQLGGSSPSGLFATDPAGADTTTTLQIPSGASQTTFYYTDPVAGTATVNGTPSAPDMTIEGFEFTVTSARPPVSPLPSTMFSYPSFSPSYGSSLNLIGNAKIVGNLLSLAATTDPAGAGAAWYPAKVPIDLPWTTQFTYQIAASGGSPEGLAFVIQNQSAGPIGTAGASLGLGGIQPVSQAVIISLTSNPSLGSWPTPPFIAVINSGSTAPLAPSRANAVAPSPSASLPSLAGTQSHTVTITYTPSNGGLVSVYLDGGTQPVTQAAINLSGGGILPIASAWIGFTSTNGTGANNATVQILSWTFGPTPEPQLASAVTVALGAANPTTGAVAPAVVQISSTLEVSGGPNGATWTPIAPVSSVPFTLSSTSSTGQFSATAGGAAQSTIDVPAGAPTVTFFYSDTVAGPATITGTPQVAGLAGFSILVLIVSPAG